MADNNNSKKGFASMSDERKVEIQAKSLATRKRNKLEREQKEQAADEKRATARELRNQAELLEQEADAIDGQHSSDKARKKYEAELADEITEAYGTTVSPQYLKQMIQHAILRELTCSQLVTPTMVAMDILNDADASASDKRDSMKMLQAFQSAKPQMIEEVETTIGSVQDEMDKLMDKHDSLAPKVRTNIPED